MTVFELMATLKLDKSEYEQGLSDAETDAEKGGQSIGQKVTGGLNKAAKTFAPFSAAAAAVLVPATKGAMDYQDSVAKVTTLLDMSQTSVGDLQDMFLGLSDATGLSASSIAEAGYQALSASVDYDHLGSFLDTATSLAKVGFTDTATATDVLTTAINAYGMQSSDANDIAQKLVQTQNLGKTTVSELASSMGRVIPIASSSNVSLDNLTTAYALLTKNGISTAQSTTYMAAMLNELSDSGTDVGSTLEDRTGKSFQELMADGWSLSDVLGLLKQAADDSGKGFNELWGQSTAGAAAMTLLNAGSEEWNSTMEVMQGNTDVLGEGLEKLHTPAQMMREALNQLKNSGIELGMSLIEVLAPMIEQAATAISNLTSWFNGLDDGTKRTIITVLALVAAATPVIGVISGIVSAIGFLFSPIGLIVTAIIGVVSVITYLWNTSESFRSAVIAIWNGIKTGVTTAINVLKSGAIAAWNGIKTGVTTIVNGIKTTVTNVWNAIKTAVSTAINGVKSAISTGMNAAKSTVSSILDAIKSKFVSIFDGVKNAVRNAINTVKSIMNFSWHLPHLSLPHISISGGFSLNPPSVPHFGISWNKKALRNAYLLDDATIFGERGGTLLGGGEAGSEMIIGTGLLQGMIDESVKDATVEESNTDGEILKQILTLLRQYIPDMANMQLVTDTGALVGQLAPAMDEQLGVIARRRSYA